METTKIALGRNRVVSMGSRVRRRRRRRRALGAPSLPRARHPLPVSRALNRLRALAFPPPLALPPHRPPNPVTRRQCPQNLAICPQSQDLAIFPQSIPSLFRDESTPSAFVNLQARQGRAREEGRFRRPRRPIRFCHRCFRRHNWIRSGSHRPGCNDIISTTSKPSICWFSCMVEYFFSGGFQCKMYPPGGFTNLLQSNTTPENFHLVGNTRSHAASSPTTPSLKRSLPVESDAQDKETINIEVDETNEDERTEKRLNWTKPEDVRLASAWLRNSKDPVDGTDRKGDQFWTAVTEEYNEGTKVSRRRNRNQLKIRWDRVKKPVMDFHGCWTNTTKVYRSGVSDDQLMEMADKMYASQHNDKEFMLKHIWKVVRYERKWSAYVKNELEKEKKGAPKSAAEVVNLVDNPNIRPIGHKKAKNELYGKRKKTSDAYSAISEKIDKFMEASTSIRKDREKKSEVQQNLANSKVEAAKLAHKTTQEQTKAKMLDTYKELLLASTSNLSAQAVAERDKALEGMRRILFATDN